MEQKLAHLTMIQGVVNRLASNSFLLKGWSVTLVSALLALAAGSKALYLFLAYLPVVAFWILDGYFLHQERLFRALYDRVRGLSEEAIDFSMNTAGLPVASWLRTMFSKTLLLFHGMLLLALSVVAVIWWMTN